ncbi:MFS transporter [Microbacterium karelineae]|uniref:MFS transporter n=1 Tax=Microbacterium karelineae TaxID=2654283 RepID=UPI0012EA2868|nr:MFS transporter [Microbacterium karelineae]
MTHADTGARVPLRVPTATATFAIGIAGYLGVNLSPYMITAAQEGLGLDVLAASWLVTATLLLTAVTGLAIAPLCAGPRRRTVARVGLVAGLVAFGGAALAPALILPGLLIGGAGVGCAVAASGAALAAFRNPDRVAGVNGLANRGVITVVLAVVPVVGLAPLQVFGSLALFSLIGLVLTAWLPAAPIAASHAGSAVAEAMPIEVPPTGTVRTGPVPSRAVTIAGFSLLVVFVLWAVSEDSLWAMGGVMGAAQASLTPAGLGIALSAATAGGLLGSIGLMIVGDRLGRAAPLVVLLVAGGVLKILHGYVTDPTLFIVVFVGWNTIYALAFMYFVSTAAALDADGRWSGPLLAVYLIGSALTPVIGAALTGAFGFEAFAIILGVASFVLAVPTALIARLSSRAGREAAEPVREVAA